MRSDDERRTIAELGFSNWLREVLWYHYKWFIIGGAVLLFAFAVIVVWQSQVEENDINVVLVTSDELSYETQIEIKAAIGAYTGDINGDGKIVIALAIIDPDGGTFSINQSGGSALTTSIANPDIVLYIMDETNTKRYIIGNTDIFNELIAAEYGGEKCAIPLDGSYLFDSLGLEGFSAGIKNKSYKVEESDEEYYALARTVLEGILSREQ